MNYCSKCSKSEDEIRLYDGIFINESIKICERCSLLEGIPIIKIPSTGQLKESEKPGRSQVYTRLKRMAGIKEEKQSKSIFEELKDLEDDPESQKPLDAPLKFVDNFYWIIQRERRKNGMSHKQLAEAIGESEMAVKLIERNNLPEDALKMIKKLEQFLRVKLIKPDPREEERQKNLLTEKRDINQAANTIEDSYTEIIVNPDHEKNVQAQLEEEAAIKRIKEDHLEKVKEKESVDNELKEVVKNAPQPPIQKESSQILNFKGEKLNKVTISDLQQMNKLVEEDFPTKTKEEIGKEQLEDFGKSSEGDEERKGWYSDYMRKKTLGEKQEEKEQPTEDVKPIEKEDISSQQQIPVENVPSIHELVEKKEDSKKDEGLVGDEIEIDELEEI